MPSERYAYYLDQCREHHATNKTFSGRGVLKHKRALLRLSETAGCTSGLDYGCGKGTQYEEAIDEQGRSLEDALGFAVRKYDPAVPRFSFKPEGTFDLVFCTDVLEHIPEEDQPWIIDEIVGFARKALFITVGSYPAKKRLPNGENAHICLKPKDWWEKLIDDRIRASLARDKRDLHVVVLAE